ncbi:hypothetical protein N7466_004860 [Penicillium verhagenii]|uniref:uncharacterized protein n=1 Tax=Penicillium verhagenii TaxID=1562060 RepID=UPI002544D4F0|nr:uncharacterized protein N7466_004860 [Penicillium verhagenii]KAJ5935313.1 hypothetical protein N7466_004860 [Penicillium verhagenii]
MVEMLGPLPARPPTPPRPGSRIDQDEIENPTKSITATPQPASASRVPPSSRTSKRVTWSPCIQTSIDLPSGPLSKFGPNTSLFKPKEPKTRDSPYKSILKETNSPMPILSPKFDPFTSDSLAMLLESVIQQLAGESITSRLDAYTQFFNALRAYDSLPTAKDIADKLSLITEFIQRDLNRDLVKGATLDTNLANWALKLSAVLTWHPDVSPLLPEEFKVFLIEHSTTCLQDAKVPKSVLTHYMSILSSHNFGPRIMTNARVTRLLTAVQEIGSNGKAIALHRLTIYQRLLTQSKSTFISHSSLWAENLIYGLLHSMKENRLKAISLGFQIASTAGPNHTLSKHLRDLFDRPLEKEQRFVHEVRERMSRMIATPDTGIHVPQIWSIIVLLMRSKGWDLERWEHFKDWVLILQKCLNCSEHSIKAQAILGWNRFVFAVGPNEKTSLPLIKMLCKPILSQFERRKSDKSVPEPTPFALSSYYNLLYYAFRPSPPANYLDLIWEEYIAGPSSSIFSSVPALCDSEARVLAAILWSPQAKIWTENRIDDTNKMEVEELPSVDSKWVRSRVSGILRVFESLLKVSVWDDNELDKSNIARAWVSLSSALSFASSKEITPSTESMQAVASVVGLLHRLWNIGLTSLNVSEDGEVDVFFERFRFLSTTMISSLGSIPFTERLLVKSSDGIFQASNTPTHRQSSSGSNLNSPILHLLQVISVNSISATPTLAYVRLAEGMIQASCKGRISRGSRLELLQQCAFLSIAESTYVSHPSSLSEVVWKASARAAADALQSFPVESARERDGSVSRDYENVTKILASGLRLRNVFQEWSHLLGSFMRVARTEKGDQGLPALIIEPLAGCLVNLPVYDTYLPSASLLSQSLSIPFLQGNEVGDGHTVAQQPSPPPFPYKLVESIGRTLSLAYDGFSVSESHGLAGFIESLTSFLGSGVPHFRSQLLQTLQPFLKPWIQDGDSKFDFKHGVDSRILTAVRASLRNVSLDFSLTSSQCRALTFAVLNVLQTCVRDDLSSLKKFDVVICAGLESPHASRAKKFVDFWYSTATKTDAASCTSSIGRSVATALENLKAAAQSKHDDKVDTKSVLSTPSRVLIISQNTLVSSSAMHSSSFAHHDPRAFLYPNSSPVIGGNEQPSPDVSDSNEPQLPANPRSDPNGDSGMVSYPGSRRDMFRMIEAIRSSSPSNTPAALGFATPVHLRRERGTRSSFGTPLTPTLAMAENEDPFVGSSPTPATRDPTPSQHSDASILRRRDVVMTGVTDVPSSPPVSTSGSPSPKKQDKQRRGRWSATRSKRQHVAAAGHSTANSPPVSVVGDTAGETPGADVSDELKENTLPSQDERRPSRRTRSALSQSTENNQNSAPASAFGTPSKPIEPPSARSSRSKSASQMRARNAIPKAVHDVEQHQYQPAAQPDALPTHTAIDYVDSSGDDLDVQIASQLSQDLGLAVDQSSQHEEQSAEVPTSVPSQSSKKRKRSTDDGPPMTAKGRRRRSTRLSTAQETVPVDVQDPEATQSQEHGLHFASVASSPAKASASTPRRSTRSSQRQGETTAVDPSISIDVVEASQDKVDSLNGSQLPPKRTRKSARGEEQSSANVVSPAQNQSPRRTRAGRSRLSQNQNQRQATPPFVLPEPEPSSNQPGLHIAHTSPQPDPFAMNSTADRTFNLDSPLVSTEEATASQVTEAGPLPPPISEDDDTQMDVDTVMSTNEIPDHPAESAITIKTDGVQTQHIPTSPPDTSDAGITGSLKQILDNIKQANFGMGTLREIDDLIFEIRVEAHGAARRHNNSA